MMIRRNRINAGKIKNNAPYQNQRKKEVFVRLIRLEKTSPESLEATVRRNYLEWILAYHGVSILKKRIDIAKARQLYLMLIIMALKKKDRILDFISIRKLKKKMVMPDHLLCLVHRHRKNFTRQINRPQS